MIICGTFVQIKFMLNQPQQFEDNFDLIDSNFEGVGNLNICGLITFFKLSLKVTFIVISRI